MLLAPSSPGPSAHASSAPIRDPTPERSPTHADNHITAESCPLSDHPPTSLVPPPPPSVTRHSSLKSASRKRSLGSIDPTQQQSKENYRPKFDLARERRNFMNSAPMLSKALSFESVKSPIHENGCEDEADTYRTIPLSATKRHHMPRFEKPPPAPVRFHSDIYDTVFALQSLRSGTGWTDYLSKVRTMWDGHMNQRQPTSAGFQGSADNVLSSSYPSSSSSSSRGTHCIMSACPAWHCAFWLFVVIYVVLVSAAVAAVRIPSVCMFTPPPHHHPLYRPCLILVIYRRLCPHLCTATVQVFIASHCQIFIHTVLYNL